MPRVSKPVPFRTRPKNEQFHAAWAGVFEQRWREGWSLYLLTFMFQQMPGGPAAVQCQQARVVERIYGHFVTRVVRRPLAASWAGMLPVWVGAPDFPVPKYLKGLLADVIINDGQHVHLIAALPPRTRRGGVTDMVAHFVERRHVYDDVAGLQRVHVVPIVEELEYVAGYMLKTVTRYRVGQDSIIVLPRARDELRGGGAPVGRKSSIFG